MADAAKDTDQSMEEILQSIKRIIAEEGDPVPQDASDVLDLTNLLAGEDTPAADTAVGSISIEDIMAAPISSEPASSAKPEPTADELLASLFETPAAEPAVAEQPVVEEPVMEPEPIAALAKEVVAPPVVEQPVAFAVSEDVAEVPAASEESLVSEATLAAAAAALHALDAPASVVAPHIASHVPFRSGTTVEDLVMESLKPMLKEWLESNLPAIVERLVEKEIRKISAR